MGGLEHSYWDGYSGHTQYRSLTGLTDRAGTETEVRAGWNKGAFRLGKAGVTSGAGLRQPDPLRKVQRRSLKPAIASPVEQDRSCSEARNSPPEVNLRCDVRSNSRSEVRRHRFLRGPEDWSPKVPGDERYLHDPTGRLPSSRNLRCAPLSPLRSPWAQLRRASFSGTTGIGREEALSWWRPMSTDDGVSLRADPSANTPPWALA